MKKPYRLHLQRTSESKLEYGWIWARDSIEAMNKIPPCYYTQIFSLLPWSFSNWWEVNFIKFYYKVKNFVDKWVCL